MATVSITAANFLPSASARYVEFTAGATITRGQLYYLDTADSYRAKLADADVQASARVAGIAATDVASGQRGLGVVYDPALALGATGLTIGNPLFAGTTAGSIVDTVSDLSSGDYTTAIGLAISATAIFFAPIVSDVVRA